LCHAAMLAKKIWRWHRRIRRSVENDQSKLI
jgi:hypothetical protein